MAKVHEGEFDAPSYEYNVTQKGKVPHDAMVGYQLRKKNTTTGQFHTASERSDFYSVAAHPDAVAQLEKQLIEQGLRGTWKASFHPIGSISRTLWEWVMRLGEEAPQQQHQIAPVAYASPQPPPQIQNPQPPVYHQPPQPVQPLQAHMQPPPAPPPPYPYQQVDAYGRPIAPQPSYPVDQYGRMVPPQHDPHGPYFARDPRFGWNGAAQQPIAPAPPAPDPQIAILREELAEQKRERERDRIERAEERKRQEEKDRDAVAKAREDALLAAIRDVRTDNDSKIEKLLARIDAQATAAPKTNVVDQITALATVLAPHLVTMRDNAQRQESESRAREQKLIELMMDRRTDPMVEKVLAQFDELRNAAKGQSPGEQVAIMQAASQAMFGGFSMSMKMIEQMAEAMPQASPVREVAGQLLEGLKGLVETFGRSKALEAHRLQQQQSAQQSQATATVVPQQNAAVPASTAPTPDLKTRDGMQLYLRANGAPDEWCTREWASILSKIVAREDVDDVGPMLAAHIFHLWRMDTLPERLRACEKPETFMEPWETMRLFLPFERTEEMDAYVTKVLEVAHAHYSAERANDASGETEESSEEPEAEAPSTNGAAAAKAVVVPSVPAGAKSAAA